MPRIADLLAASGWRRTFDGTALPNGAAAFVGERCPPEAGAILVLGGARSAWVPALLAAGRRTAVLDVSRKALARLEATHPSSGGEAPLLDLVHGDPRDFESVPGAGSVLLPSPLLASLGTPDERRDVLRGALSQVGPGGPVVIHHEPVPEDLLPSPGGEARVIEDVPFADPDRGSPWTRTTTVEREPNTGRILLRHGFAAEGGREEEARGLLLTALDREGILPDLGAAGLAVAETLGGFDGCPPAPGGALILVARPAGD